MLFYFKMTALLGTVFFNNFVSVDVVRFKRLSDLERLEIGGQKAIALEFRVILKTKPTEASELTLRQSFTERTNLGAVTIEQLDVGGKYYLMQ